MSAPSRLVQKVALASFAWLALGAFGEVSSPTELPKRLIKLNASDSDRAVYLETTKSTIFSGTPKLGILLALKFANVWYREEKKAGRKVEFEALRTSLNEVLVKVKELSKSLEDPSAVSTLGTDLARHLTRLFRHTRLPTNPTDLVRNEVIHSVADFATEVLNGTVLTSQGPSKLLRAQHELRFISLTADSILSEAYENAIADRRFADVINVTIGPETRSYVGFPAKYNLDMNLKLQDSYRTENIAADARKILEHLQANLNEKGELTIDYAPIAKMLHELQGNLTQEVQTQTDKILSRLDEQDRQQKSSAEAAMIRKAKYQAASSSVYLISGIAALVDRDSAKCLQATGTASIQIASALEEYQALSQVGGWVGSRLVSSVNLVGAVASAVEGLLSLFGGTTPEQQILEEIAKLGEQIRILEKGMHERFDHVDRQLSGILYSLRAGFEEIDRGLNQSHLNQQNLLAAIAGIQSELSKLNLQTYGYLRDLSRERIEEDTQFCLQARSLSAIEFERCLQRFTAYATRHASNTLASGGTLSALGEFGGPEVRRSTQAYSSLSQELQKGLWNNINLVSGFLAWRFGNAALGSAPNPLANLSDWATYANDFTYFVSNQALFLRTHAREITHAGEAIQSVGTQLGASLSRLATSRPQVDGRISDIFQELLYDYRAQTMEVETALDKNFSDFKRNRAKDYDPFVSWQNQEKVFQIPFRETGRGTMGLCEGSPAIAHSKSDAPNLVLPENVHELVPHVWQMAEDMELGRVQICYRDLHWGEPYELLHLEFKADSYSKTRDNAARVSRDDARKLDEDREAVLKLLKKDASQANRYWVEVAQYSDISKKFKDSRLLRDRFLVPIGSRVYGRVSLMMQFVFRPVQGEPLLFDSRLVQGNRADRHFGSYALTVENEGEMKNRHGADRSKWPSRHGIFQVYDSGDNGFGLSEQERGGASLIQNELERQWAVRDGMASRLVKESTSTIVRSIDEKAAELVQANLENLRQGYSGELLAAVQTPGVLKQAIGGMTGAKQTLQSVLEYAYPQSMAADALRPFFFGANPLADGKTFQSDFAMGKSVTEIRTDLVESNVARVGTLGRVLGTMVSEVPGGEEQPLLRQTLSRLELLQETVDVGYPKVPIADAVRSVREVVHGYLGE